MTDRALMQMALDALKDINRTGDTQAFDLCVAPKLIPALRERLSHPEPEPVLWVVQYSDRHEFVWGKEPVFRNNLGGVLAAQSFYVEPPRKEWVGLTDDDYEQLLEVREWGVYLIEAVEQKLKEKNT